VPNGRFSGTLTQDAVPVPFSAVVVYKQGYYAELVPRTHELMSFLGLKFYKTISDQNGDWETGPFMYSPGDKYSITALHPSREYNPAFLQDRVPEPVE
jgi:hypothetical protein